MKAIGFLLSLLFLLLPHAHAGVGVLGTPVQGSTVSGVGVISGYHCTSKNIEIFIDGVSIGPAGAGTRLLGTQGVCGRTDTGYSLLYAFNNLSNGQHTISVTADGVEFDSHSVTTVQSGGVPWLSDVSRTLSLPNFPQSGKTTSIQWVQSYQNFLVTGITDTPALPQFAAGLTRSTVIDDFPAAGQATRVEWNEGSQSFLPTKVYSGVNRLEGTYTLSRGSFLDTYQSLTDSSQANVDMTGTLQIVGSTMTVTFVLTIDGQANTTSYSTQFMDYGYYLSTQDGVKAVIIDRGTSLILSRLYYVPGYGYTNEVEHWQKQLN